MINIYKRFKTVIREFKNNLFWYAKKKCKIAPGQNYPFYFNVFRFLLSPFHFNPITYYRWKKDYNKMLEELKQNYGYIYKG